MVKPLTPIDKKTQKIFKCSKPLKMIKWYETWEKQRECGRKKHWKCHYYREEEKTLRFFRVCKRSSWRKNDRSRYLDFRECLTLMARDSTVARLVSDDHRPCWEIRWTSSRGMWIVWKKENGFGWVENREWIGNVKDWVWIFQYFFSNFRI